LNWARDMEEEVDPAPVRADADVVVEKVIARLGVLDRTFASAGHAIVVEALDLFFFAEFYSCGTKALRFFVSFLS